MSGAPVPRMIELQPNAVLGPTVTDRREMLGAFVGFEQRHEQGERRDEVRPERLAEREHVVGRVAADHRIVFAHVLRGSKFGNHVASGSTTRIAMPASSNYARTSPRLWPAAWARRSSNGISDVDVKPPACAATIRSANESGSTLGPHNASVLRARSSPATRRRRRAGQGWRAPSNRSLAARRRDSSRTARRLP
jgi:hypothetical protein